MFGLDGDPPDIFETTVDFLIRVKAPVSFMFILAPRPGTKVRDQLLAEGRIFNHDWTNYCGFKAVYHPKHMTARQLEEGYWRANRQFYSLLSILQRLTPAPLFLAHAAFQPVLRLVRPAPLSTPGLLFLRFGREGQGYLKNSCPPPRPPSPPA